MKLAIATIALALFTATASAHPLDLGYLRVNATKTTVAATLDIDVKAAAIVLHRDNVDAAFVRDHASALANATFAQVQLTGCSWGDVSARLGDRTVTIASTATCTGDAPRSWTFPFVREHRISTKFELVLKETIGSSERLTLVDATTTAVVLATPATSSGVSFASFVGSGIVHIGAAPSEWRDGQGGWKLPDGIDHILFLLGLMLAGGTLLRMIGTATGFTVGHTITLALATLGIVHPPGWLIEPLIALSIAFVAFEALSRRLEKYRWKIALGFGLVHGFGFANALTKLELSASAKAKALCGYNLGVELGQLAIVLALAPIVLAAYKRRWSQNWVLRPAAIAIGVAGLYWFAQRVFG